MLSRLASISSSETKQSTARVPAPNIGDLPQDLLNQIFGKLGPHDLQAAALTSQGMNRSVKEAAHFHEFHSLKKFIRILMQKLPGQKELLAEIAQNMVFQDFANLQKLKEYILDVKAQLIGVIKTVDVETAKGLHDVQPPHFLENIFTLAALERRIDEAHLIRDENERDDALLRISEALARAGDRDKSLVIATLILDDYTKGYALRNISKALAQAGDIDRALEVVWLISGTWWAKADALREISKALAQKGDIERSLAVAESISHKDTREGALQDISRSLTQAGNFDRSVVVASSIPDEERRGEALRNISKALARAGNICKIYRAVVVATSIPNEKKMVDAIWDISEAITQAGKDVLSRWGIFVF